MIKNPLLILAIAIGASSAYFNISGWCSDLQGISYIFAVFAFSVMAFFLFYISRDIARQAEWTWGRALKSVIATVLFLVSVVGAGTFWMTTQNSDYMRLTAAKTAMTRLESQMVTAQAVRDNCPITAQSKCRIPRAADYELAKTAFNDAALAYEAMVVEQSKSEATKLTTKIFCLDVEYFGIYRSLFLSFLFEIAGIYFCLKSDLKPLVERVAEEKHDNAMHFYEAALARDDLTDFDKAVLAAWHDFESKGQTLKNNLPSPVGQFEHACAGRNGGGVFQRATDSLIKMGIVK